MTCLLVQKYVFYPFIIVVYIRYEITSFFFLLPFFLSPPTQLNDRCTILLCVVHSSTVCSQSTCLPDGIAADTMKHTCTLCFIILYWFQFWILIVSSLVWYFCGLLDCHPVNEGCRCGSFWILLGVLLLLCTATTTTHHYVTTATHTGSTSNRTMQHSTTEHLREMITMSVLCVHLWRWKQQVLPLKPWYLFCQSLMASHHWRHILEILKPCIILIHMIFLCSSIEEYEICDSMQNIF